MNLSFRLPKVEIHVLLGQCGSALDSAPLPLRDLKGLPTTQILPSFFLAQTTVGVWKTQRGAKIIYSVSFLECHCPGWVQISSRVHRGVGSPSFPQWQQTLPMEQGEIAPGVCRLVLLPWRGSNRGIWGYFFYLH